MIKNVVFDMGGVIILFDEVNMVGKYTSCQEDTELVRSVMLDRLYWDKLDKGTMTDEEAVAAMKTRLPERLWKSVEDSYYNWIHNLIAVEGIEELIADLKREGKARLFLLSNISTYFAEHEEVVPVLKLFEKRIYSAVIGMVKPDREIYEYLCAECDILPEETLFIDDSEGNIKGAKSVGIHGYRFDGDSAKLRRFLEKTLN